MAKSKNNTKGVENKEYMKAILEIRRSNASGIHKTKDQKLTRGTKKREAIKRSLLDW